jgi:hypothetical protein
MRPSTRRHSEEDWLSRKPAIRDMFLRDRLSIRDIVRDLASEDFYVTYDMSPDYVIDSHVLNCN